MRILSCVLLHQFRYDDKVSSENINTPTVSGAISRIVPVRNTSIVYIGAVNGGVWKTDNINVAGVGTNIEWYPVTDQQGLGCSSIGQLAMGLNNPNWYPAHISVASCVSPHIASLQSSAFTIWIV